MSLIHCIYSSAALDAPDLPALHTLLQQARTANAAHDITGMLLYSDGCFFQVLEGEEETVRRVFARIAADPRHARVTKIIEEPLAQRSFGDWTMGFAAVSRAELREIPGFNDFFQGGSCFTDLQAGRAKKLLAAFREGRWRSRVKGRQPAPETVRA